MSKTYRVANEKGLIDFAIDLETIESKFKKYLKDGYSKRLSIIEVDPVSGKEKVLKTIEL